MPLNTDHTARMGSTAGRMAKMNLTKRCPEASVLWGLPPPASQTKAPYKGFHSQQLRTSFQIGQLNGVPHPHTLLKETVHSWPLLQRHPRAVLFCITLSPAQVRATESRPPNGQFTVSPTSKAWAGGGEGCQLSIRFLPKETELGNTKYINQLVVSTKDEMS